MRSHASSVETHPNDGKPIRELAAPSFVPINAQPDPNAVGFDAGATAARVDFRNFTFPPLDPLPALTLTKYCGPTPESNWVIPGVLLVGAYPASQSDEETFNLIASILKCGIRKFVCLQQEYVPRVTEAAWRSGTALRPYFEDVKRIVRDKHKYAMLSNSRIVDLPNLSFDHCPIVDCGVTDDDRVLRLTEQLVLDISRGQVIYLHCWGGHGRTGTVVSIMLHIMYGLSAKEAMQRCQAVHDLRMCPVDVGSPQTQQQRDQVVRVVTYLSHLYEPGLALRDKERVKRTSSRNLTASVEHVSSKHTIVPAETTDAENKKKAQLSRLSFHSIYDTFTGRSNKADKPKNDTAAPADQLPKFWTNVGPQDASHSGKVPLLRNGSNSSVSGPAPLTPATSTPLKPSTPIKPSTPNKAVGSIVVERMPQGEQSGNSGHSLSDALAAMGSSPSGGSLKTRTAHAPNEPVSSSSTTSHRRSHVRLQTQEESQQNASVVVDALSAVTVASTATSATTLAAAPAGAGAVSSPVSTTPTAMIAASAAAAAAIFADTVTAAATAIAASTVALAPELASSAHAASLIVEKQSLSLQLPCEVAPLIHQQQHSLINGVALREEAMLAMEVAASPVTSGISASLAPPSLAAGMEIDTETTNYPPVYAMPAVDNTTTPTQENLEPTMSHGSLHAALMEARRAVSGTGDASSATAGVDSSDAADATTEARTLVPIPPKGGSGKYSHMQQFHKARTEV